MRFRGRIIIRLVEEKPLPSCYCRASSYGSFDVRKVNRGSMSVVAILLASATLVACGQADDATTPKRTPPAATAAAPATFQLLEEAGKTWGTYPSQIAALAEPCEQALTDFHSVGVARDVGTADAGRRLSSSCDGIRERMLALPKPQGPTPQAQQALHMWAMTSALQAFERRNLGRVVVRYATAAEHDEAAERDAGIIQDALAQDRVRTTTVDGFLSEAVRAAGQSGGAE